MSAQTGSVVRHHHEARRAADQERQREHQLARDALADGRRQQCEQRGGHTERREDQAGVTGAEAVVLDPDRQQYGADRRVEQIGHGDHQDQRHHQLVLAEEPPALQEAPAVAVLGHDRLLVVLGDPAVDEYGADAEGRGVDPEGVDRADERDQGAGQGVGEEAGQAFRRTLQPGHALQRDLCRPGDVRDQRRLGRIARAAERSCDGYQDEEYGERQRAHACGAVAPGLRRPYWPRPRSH